MWCNPLKCVCAVPGIPNTLPALYQRATRLGVPAYSQSNFPVIYFLQVSA